MKKPFIGAWATFEFLDDTTDSITELRQSGYKKITAHTPCPRHEIQQALGNPQSYVAYATFAGASFGFLVAIVMVVGMTLDWVIPVSDKPIVSIPVMWPIVFEFSLLMAIYVTIVFIIIFIMRDTTKFSIPKSKKYVQYNRFMRDRFGVIVSCKKGEIQAVEAIFRNHQAEEVILEN